MSYKPDENVLMAYLYGELSGDEKEQVEQHLMKHPEARIELEKMQELRKLMSMVKDKEVIAPPIFVGDNKQRMLWQSPYFKTLVSIAASLLLIMVVGRLTSTSIRYSGNELKISFGKAEEIAKPVEPVSESYLTENQVQEMINNSLHRNNEALQSGWEENQQKLDASIRKNLAMNSGKIDALVREASTASQNQIRQYVATIQTENMQLVKDYFQLTSAEQKDYIEDLLVDFAKYLQQQRNDDLVLIQTQLNNLEKDTDIFKQETEQILTSLISNSTTIGTKN